MLMDFSGAQVCKTSVTPSVCVDEAEGTWIGLSGWWGECKAGHLSKGCDGRYCQLGRLEDYLGNNPLDTTVREFIDCVN